MKSSLIFLILVFSCAAQGLDPAAILKPSPDNWPTYNGDYSGRRFSELHQINRENVSTLALAWAFQTNNSSPQGLKSTPLLVAGTLYFTEPDDIWAVDARSGRQNWHYHYHENEGLHIGQRGVGMWKNKLYFETPDAHLLCLDARSGEVQWDVVLADVKLGYWATMAPLIIRNHVIVGVSGDFTDLHGFIDSFDPETGKLQWHWNALPKPGEPGSETWPKDSDAIEHGGGMTWITGTYDPSLNLLYWGTANPNPVLSGASRPGDNLYTCTIVALNPDTGKLVWHFQASPHDTHDWDAVQTPVIVDADFQGTPRKLLLQASRNGYFFVLDRTDGKALLSVPFEEINWSKGVDAKGQPDRQSCQISKYVRHTRRARCARRNQLDVPKFQSADRVPLCRHASLVQPLLRSFEWQAGRLRRKRFVGLVPLVLKSNRLPDGKDLLVARSRTGR